MMFDLKLDYICSDYGVGINYFELEAFMRIVTYIYETVSVGKNLTDKTKSAEYISPEIVKVEYYITEILDDLVEFKLIELKKQNVCVEENDDISVVVAKYIRKRNEKLER